ncbi:DUF637 domain-containing protein [Xenorhabdus szentirmaii]|uniref:DUF637 domain-containing protein n=2 Tax=Xenorhabdus szentirmaii TaxID=290112 RepID=UPI000C053D27|nr:DUF637 domain-containing protein [Xenorhabdus szentirmaii]PHM33839.1 hypothetical protein Xsze_00226 [Xenorhabdus szentirmaii DSM 16338]PHM42580.1 hypothetical protein Xszus_02319 [Xenorhabdus szentirmaii]
MSGLSCHNGAYGCSTRTAQRVAGQSLIKSGLTTSINGGSFKDNFVQSLLSTTADQIHAEGAKLVSENTPALGIPGKLFSHAAISALAAEIGGNDPLAASAGALAAEVAVLSMGENFYQDTTKGLLKTKIIGAIAGGIASNSADGVHSGAHAGELAIEFNSLAGDKARKALEADADYMKFLVREKMGENVASAMVNGVLVFLYETGHLGVAGLDTTFDATAALITCATGSNYCDRARSDLAKKDQAVANAFDSIRNGYAWEGIKVTVAKAAQGDQKSLENVAGFLIGAKVPLGVLRGEGILNKVTIKPITPKGGAGGNWNVLDEIVDPNVVKQKTPTGCGAACGEMLLKDRKVPVSQTELGGGLKSPEQLARDLNKYSSDWDGGFVGLENFHILNSTGSWAAMMWDQGSRIGHWVVVKGIDKAGNILIHDPWKGTSYKMTIDNFNKVWNEIAVFKQK